MSGNGSKTVIMSTTTGRHRTAPPGLKAKVPPRLFAEALRTFLIQLSRIARPTAASATLKPDTSMRASGSRGRSTSKFGPSAAFGPRRASRRQGFDVKTLYMNPSDRGWRRPHSYHHGNLKEVLLEAARKLIEQYGPAGFSLTEAARLAGVSPA